MVVLDLLKDAELIEHGWGDGALEWGSAGRAVESRVGRRMRRGC